MDILTQIYSCACYQVPFKLQHVDLLATVQWSHNYSSQSATLLSQHSASKLSASVTCCVPHCQRCAIWLNCAGQGDEGRLRELCMELMGNGQDSSSSHSEDTGWSPIVCGLDKRKLLQRDVLKEALDGEPAATRRVKAEMSDLLSSLQEHRTLPA